MKYKYEFVDEMFCTELTEIWRQIFVKCLKLFYFAKAIVSYLCIKFDHSYMKICIVKFFYRKNVYMLLTQSQSYFCTYCFDSLILKTDQPLNLTILP